MFAPKSDTNSGSGFVVLGVDPGLTRCGYAAIEVGQTRVPTLLKMGVVSTDVSAELPDRLATLQADFEILMDEAQPDAVAVEQVFFQNNVRTAMGVGQASGLVLAMAARRGIHVVQYTPSQVKSAVTGSGTANKLQVQQMVQRQLKLRSLPQPPDAADAAALALCHLAVSPMRQSIARSTVGARS
jgi:crossover junction endodeoxyribonuclease RuvC